MADRRPPPPRVLPARRNRRPVLLAATLGGLLTLLAAVLAGFGWLDLLRALGAAGLGPRVPDTLPLRRLAAGSAQPLVRVLVAFGSVGLAAGFALSGLPRPARFGLLAAGSLGLLALASEVAYGVQETQTFATTISTRHPGSGVLLEAVVLALAGVLPGAPSRGDRRRPAG